MTTSTQPRNRHPEGTPVGGQFAAEQRPGAGITLTEGANPPNPARLGVQEEVDYMVRQLTGSKWINSARLNGSGQDPTFPHAEHEAALAALRAYSEALGSDLSPAGVRTGDHGKVNLPMFIDAELRPYHNEPLPQWPASVAEPEVSFELEDGMIKTTVSFDGRWLNLWTISDETYTSSETDDSILDGIEDEDAEAIEEWAREVHDRIEGTAYGVQIDAVNRIDVRDTVIKLALSEPED